MIRAAILALVLLFAAAGASRAEPSADLWPQWLAHDPASTLAVDHGEWDGFVHAYVVPGIDGVNRVAYGRVSGDDRAILEAYIAKLAAVPVSRLDRDQQLALWVNLYNALTVKVVLDHYPVKSIRDIDISPGLFADGPWGKKLVSVEATPLSLDDIEHRILRPIWKDARLHYMLNCAAVGCPNLQPSAVTAENWDDLFSRAARQYVNHPRGVGFDGMRLVVSSIYGWYEGDFGGSESAVIDHLRRYAEAPLHARLAGARRVDDMYYDWALNDAN